MTSPPFPSKVKHKHDLRSNPAGKIRHVSRPPPGWPMTRFHPEDGRRHLRSDSAWRWGCLADRCFLSVPGRPVCLEGSQESVRSHTNRDSARGSRQEFVQGSTSKKEFSGKSGGQDEPAHNEKLKSKKGKPRTEKFLEKKKKSVTLAGRRVLELTGI